MKMLSLSQKESILQNAGVAVPPFPVRSITPQSRHERSSPLYPAEQRQANEAFLLAVSEWRATIEALYIVWYFEHYKDMES